MSRILDIGAVMPHSPSPAVDDDLPVVMTMNERTSWAYLGTVTATSAVYLALMVTRVLRQPVAEVSWVVPMLWTIAVSVTATVLATIAVTIVAAVRTARTAGCADAGEDVSASYGSDVRDAEIDRRGGGASAGIFGAGMAAALALAMVGAEPFWIGNALFLFAMAGALVETVTKIRLYRRGF